VERVTVLVDPADYSSVLEEIERDGGIGDATRLRLAEKAFAHTAAYDAAIANWLSSRGHDASKKAPFPRVLTLQWQLRQPLRYGENPHQSGAFYVEPETTALEISVAHARVLQGKELSYNNILDLDAALALVSEFSAPACAIIKHTNPCGVGQSAQGCVE